MSQRDKMELADLPTYRLEDWHKAIDKSLKEGSWEDYIKTRNSVNIQAFLNSENTVQRKALKKSEANWKIGVNINQGSSQKMNESILHYLNLGAEAISIPIDPNTDVKDLLKDVNTEYIYTDIQSADQAKVNFEFGKTDVGCIPQDNTPISFHRYTLQSSTQDVCAELEEISNSCVSLLEKGVPPNVIRVKLNIDAYIPIAVSKIRAMRILWLNILQAYDHELTPAFIRCDSFSKQTDKNEAMIDLSICAMNSVLGGCDLLYLNGDGFDENQKRLAMNIQHIMKMESKLHLVQDPLAGSYSIEHITEQICMEVWNRIAQPS